MQFFLGILFVVVVGSGLTLLACLAWLALDSLAESRQRLGRQTRRPAQTPAQRLRKPPTPGRGDRLTQRPTRAIRPYSKRPAPK